MAKITDIWFKTDLSLRDLGKKLGVTNINYDMENYWEWITGNFKGFWVDITRTHTTPAQDTPTRVFASPREMPEEFIESFITKLQELNITPVHLGSWIYKNGNEFDLQVVKTVNN